MFADIIYICHDTLHILKSIQTVFRRKLEKSPEAQAVVYEPKPLTSIIDMAGPFPTRNVRKLSAKFIYLKEAVAQRFFDYVIDAQMKTEQPVYRHALDVISEAKTKMLELKKDTKIVLIERWQTFKKLLETGQTNHGNFEMEEKVVGNVVLNKDKRKKRLKLF